MKMVSGALLLVAAEQAFAHSQLVQFPTQDEATRVLIPASVVFLAVGAILLVWGIVTEAPRGKGSDR